MSLFTLYLMAILPNIQAVLGINSGIILMLSIIGFMISCTDSNKEGKGTCRKLVVGASCGLLLAALIPTTEGLYFMTGGYIANQITQVEGVEKLPANVIGALNSFLEDIKEEKK